MTLYDIKHDPSGIVRVVLRGRWSLDVLDRFNDDLDCLIARHQAGPTGGAFKMLVDGREQGVQSREVIEALQRRASKRSGTEVRIAVVVATMLRKLQAERVSPAANRAIFFDEGGALEWLRAG